jgi:hypothetical protein
MKKKSIFQKRKSSTKTLLSCVFLISILIWSVYSAGSTLNVWIISQLPSSVLLHSSTKSQGGLKQPKASLKQNRSTKPSYIGAILAEESLVFAVASDLRTYLHLKGKTNTKLLDEIHAATFKLYSTGVTPTENGGWLLQPGKLKDDYDYLYAGHHSVPTLTICASPNSEDPRCNLAPRPIDGIGMDVSHFLAKWPIFLTAYRDASYDNSTRRDFFERLISGVEVQIFNHVIKPQQTRPPYLLTNYMDGTNGVFRWNYLDRGKNWGYNSFALSSTPCYSSIALLNSDRVRELYKRIYKALPYTPTEVKMMGGKMMGGDACNSDEARLLTSLSSRFLDNSKDGVMSISNIESQLFAKTFAHSLRSRDSWIGDNAYQGVVGQRQIVLHSAFLAHKKEWIDTFTAHFKLFLENVRSHGWPETSDYYKWHQLLFASRYLVLSAHLNIDSDMHSKLYEYLYKKIAHAWEGKNSPVSNYGWGEPKFTNYRDWVRWKTELAK